MEKESQSSKLNWKEERVVARLKEVAPSALTIRELARKCFPGVRPASKADSQVRNSLRKPTRLRMIKKAGEGAYKAEPRA